MTICKSKKKPLLLVAKSKIENGDDQTLLFKTGDDLRQDMLTM